ncbi:GntR family transcriptional regulator [Paenibacillus fonticola]|uniref:GntR family transcriptional regulator n=1 Tax=Paenibacillus fonticola TaxID=379896 RepID=UPI000372EBCD|nr:GntR family transcriptional regulator [Paenibacillus fonticola]
MKEQPLYKQIQEKIKEQVRLGILRPGDRVGSEKELSQLYRVSQITTKNALIGLAEEGWVNRIQGKGTFVSPQSAQMRPAPASPTLIGVIFPSMKTRVDQQLLNFIEQYAYEEGFQILLRITRESAEGETQSVRQLMDMGIKGLIIFPTEAEIYNETIIQLSFDKFPVVLIDRFFKNIRVSRVTTDNIQGTFDAITYLLNKGHRHIAYISPEITNSVTEDRAAGYENAYLEQQFPIDKTLWCLLSLQTIQQGRAKDEIAEFLKEREHVTAIFTVNVQLAHFVYNYLRDYDLLDRIELITFDDPELPDVSYVAQNIEEISQKSIEFLKIQLQGTEAPLQHLEPATLRLKNES